MNGVMSPGVSEGSKSEGAGVKCSAHVSWPAGGSAASGDASSRSPSATAPITARRVGPLVMPDGITNSGDLEVGRRLVEVLLEAEIAEGRLRGRRLRRALGVPALDLARLGGREVLDRRASPGCTRLALLHGCPP